jgi:hypothetical protein
MTEQHHSLRRYSGPHCNTHTIGSTFDGHRFSGIANHIRAAIGEVVAMSLKRRDHSERNSDIASLDVLGSFRALFTGRRFNCSAWLLL